MGGLVTGLFFLGQANQAQSSVAPQALGTARSSEAARNQPVDARSLLPARAYLVIEFEGRLTGASPFGSNTGACAKVSPPERVGLAVGEEDGALPSVDGRTNLTAGGTVLFLVSPAVTPEFWRCVRTEILSAGGHPLSSSPDEEALESPNGVVLYSRGRLLFSSDRTLLPELLALAAGRAPSAASTPPHSTLVTGLAPSRDVRTAPLVATLHFREDWLADLGEEALKTPLRHLRAGSLRAEADGSATGTLECLEPGCEELAAFLLRARADLGKMLPPALGDASTRSWKAALQRVSPARGVIRLTWEAQGMTFSDWAGGLWQHLSNQPL